jgi:TonB family protein
MKPTAGYAKLRRMTEPPRRTRLNLQRRPRPEPEDELDAQRRGTFWKWVLVVALLHLLVITGACVYYLFMPAAKPPEQFISLLPPGDTVHGSPGRQEAHKLGAHTPAAPSHHAAPPPPAEAQPQPTPVTPPQEKSEPPPILKDNAPPVKTEKPQKPRKLEKPKPAKPKVKVDLNEVERSVGPAATKPAKHHAKKPVKKPEDAQDDADSSPDNSGLTKQQIADKLGEKLEAEGSHNAQKYGDSGAPDGHKNKFQDFYDMIAEQVRDAWNSPMSAAETEPIVSMRVERDGRVAPESVQLITSSGDAAYDDAAVATVKRLGYLHEPLPDGCPPVITIHFNPNPSQ